MLLLACDYTTGFVSPEDAHEFCHLSTVSCQTDSAQQTAQVIVSPRGKHSRNSQLSSYTSFAWPLTWLHTQLNNCQMAPAFGSAIIADWLATTSVMPIQTVIKYRHAWPQEGPAECGKCTWLCTRLQYVQCSLHV